MKLTIVEPPPRKLQQLGEVELNERNQKLLEQALRHSGGDAPWRACKEAEARDLLRLSQLAPPGRLHIDMLDLRQNLRAVLFMRVKVACRPDQQNRLPVADFAVLGLTYPRQVLQQRLPGMAFVQILEPHGVVWHANVGEDGQPLCLGGALPVGIPVVELVLMSYGALSMQAVMIDEHDAAGLLNRQAARWWRKNVNRIPLSKTPFLMPDQEKGTAP